MPEKRINNLWLLHLFADFCAIVCSYYLTMWIRFHSVFGGRVFDGLNRALNVRSTGELGSEFELFYAASAFRIICFLAIIVCGVYALRDLYTERRFIIRQPVAANVLVANVVDYRVLGPASKNQRNQLEKQCSRVGFFS